jgi:hypothetical protein
MVVSGCLQLEEAQIKETGHEIPSGSSQRHFG